MIISGAEKMFCTKTKKHIWFMAGAMPSMQEGKKNIIFGKHLFQMQKVNRKEEKKVFRF